MIIQDGVVPWVEKYRPDNLHNIHGHEEILSTLQRFMRANQLPNLLLHGPAGTGKTTTAVAICKQIFGNKEYKMSTLELNASDDRGIGVIRNEVKNFAQSTSFGSFTFEKVGKEQAKQQQETLNDGDVVMADAAGDNSGGLDIYAKIRSQYKVVILDEADSMTNVAQFALRRMIEQYSSNVRFMIICNFAHKIIPALVSRCTAFRFSVLPEEHTAACVHKVAQHENLDVDVRAVSALQKCSNGDLRKVLNMLQSLAILEKAKKKKLPSTSASNENAQAHKTRISEAEIYRSLGLCTPQELDLVVKELLTNSDPEKLVQLILSQRGNLQSMLPGLHARLIKLPFKAPATRLKVVEALSSVEWRFTQGAFKPEYEAAYLVNEIMVLRAGWQY
ncbi:unnamed protein product [Amoebophrya sp. A120]|nr:unnamed protein product [Amoebophrya sp. A120]|eukprot:GSA120T00004239001.1